jgi:hypothetical protein
MFLPEDCNLKRKVVTINSKYLIIVVCDVSKATQTD